MKFTISNNTVKAGTLPPNFAKIRNTFLGLPDGELLTYREAAARLGVSRSTITNAKMYPALDGLWVIATVSGRRCVLFANSKTIKAYSQEFGI